MVVVLVFLAVVAFVEERLFPAREVVAVAPAPAAVDPDCIPPDWAVAMGHGEMWKLHHNCR